MTRFSSISALCLLLLLGVPGLGGCSSKATRGDPSQGLAEQLPQEEEPQIDLQDSEVIPLGDSPGLGQPSAWVQVVLFADLSDPFSGRLAMILEETLETLPRGTARLVFKHLPAEDQPRAFLAAQAAEAAANQGQFWAYQDLVFEKPYLFERSDEELHQALLDYADALGLDSAQFQRDLQNEEIRERIEADLQLGKSLGVHTAPAVFINGGFIAGVQAPEIYSGAILEVERILKEAVRTGEMTREEVYWRSVDTLFSYTGQRRSRDQNPPQSVVAIPVDEPQRLANLPLKESLVNLHLFLSLGATTSLDQLLELQEALKLVDETSQKGAQGVRISYFHLPHDLDAASLLAHRALAAARSGEQIDELLRFLKTHRDWLEDPTSLQRWLEEAQWVPLSEEEFFARLDGDLQAARAFSVHGTPTLFLNGRRFTGVQPAAELAKGLEFRLEESTLLFNEGYRGRQLYERLLEEEANR